jgi:hypothetical protein
MSRDVRVQRKLRMSSNKVTTPYIIRIKFDVLDRDVAQNFDFFDVRSEDVNAVCVSVL